MSRTRVLLALALGGLLGGAGMMACSSSNTPGTRTAKAPPDYMRQPLGDTSGGFGGRPGGTGYNPLGAGTWGRRFVDEPTQPQPSVEPPRVVQPPPPTEVPAAPVPETDGH
jgi:hypothetical protein